ncbi:hypothetical protein GCM10019016_051210 [Streptomyces prasinosporus]|uniref:Uncharacterized protein n=1 Tax=Streptomyces prasinosporus TaxID=68256 RepID=A0ABP6TRS3_9ACTN
MPSSVSPWQSTEATVSSLPEGADEEPPLSPKDAVQLSHRTPAFRRLSSSVTVSSVVYATAAELSPPGSHATIPPTAATTSPAATTGRRHRVPRRIPFANAPMDGSLPPPPPGR